MFSWNGVHWYTIGALKDSHKKMNIFCVHPGKDSTNNLCELSKVKLNNPGLLDMVLLYADGLYWVLYVCRVYCLSLKKEAP